MYFYFSVHYPRC